MARSGECSQCGNEYERLHQHWSMSQTCDTPANESPKKTYTCAECGDTFEDYPTRREQAGREDYFCDKDCKDSYAKGDGPETTCANCGDGVYVPPSQIDSMGDYSLDNHFCDKRCEGEWKRENWVGEDHPSHRGKVATFCEECGQIYEVKPSLVEISRFCCMECKREAWADDPLKLQCPVCGERFERESYKVKGDVATCSKECFRAYLSQIRMGEDNPAYKGGPIGSYGGAWGRFRRAALERANYCCELCGKTNEQCRTDHGCSLHGHHITPVRTFDDPSKAHETSEVMMLCIPCHNEADNYAPLHPRVDMARSA
jgi:hypothetical protein